MFHYLVRVVAVACLGLLGVAVVLDRGRCDPPDQTDGVEVMARGPVHEAFAESINGPAAATAVVAKQPPDPIEEMPPDQKPEGDNVQWIPGYFAWDETRNDYLWVSGFWRVPPPERQWTPGHWKQADAGWQWAPGFWSHQEQKEVTYLPPPPAPVEAATPSVPAPGADYTYVSGCWIYRDGRYVWRPGYWAACQPGWIWTPAHYVWSPCGYVYVEGYWDYPLRQRGLLFAPVVVDVRVCRPGWVYSPRFVVQDDVLVGAMFVRPGVTCYYFGDYFEPRYRDSGYVAWVDVRVGGGRDPLFAYYAYDNRGRAGWEVSIRASYGGMYSGTVARPSTTIVQNNVTVNNVTNVTNINNTNINNNVTNNKSMVTSITQVNSVKLQPVSAAQRQVAKQQAQQIVQASQQRSQSEAQILAKGPPPSKPTDAPRTAALPKTSSAAPKASTATPPPAHTEAKTATSPGQTHPGTVAPAATHATTQPAGNKPATPAQPAHTTPSQQHPANAHTPPAHPAQPATHPTTTPPHPATTPPAGSNGAPPAGQSGQSGQQPQQQPKPQGQQQ